MKLGNHLRKCQAFEAACLWLWMVQKPQVYPEVVATFHLCLACMIWMCSLFPTVRSHLAVGYSQRRGMAGSVALGQQ